MSDLLGQGMAQFQQGAGAMGQQRQQQDERFMAVMAPAVQRFGFEGALILDPDNTRRFAKMVGVDLSPYEQRAKAVTEASQRGNTEDEVRTAWSSGWNPQQYENFRDQFVRLRQGGGQPAPAPQPAQRTTVSMPQNAPVQQQQQPGPVVGFDFMKTSLTGGEQQRPATEATSAAAWNDPVVAKFKELLDLHNDPRSGVRPFITKQPPEAVAEALGMAPADVDARLKELGVGFNSSTMSLEMNDVGAPAETAPRRELTFGGKDQGGQRYGPDGQPIRSAGGGVEFQPYNRTLTQAFQQDTGFKRFVESYGGKGEADWAALNGFVSELAGETVDKNTEGPAAYARLLAVDYADAVASGMSPEEAERQIAQHMQSGQPLFDGDGNMYGPQGRIDDPAMNPAKPLTDEGRQEFQQQLANMRADAGQGAYRVGNVTIDPIGAFEKLASEKTPQQRQGARQMHTELQKATQGVLGELRRGNIPQTDPRMVLSYEAMKQNFAEQNPTQFNRTFEEGLRRMAETEQARATGEKARHVRRALEIGGDQMTIAMLGQMFQEALRPYYGNQLTQAQTEHTKNLAARAYLDFLATEAMMQQGGGQMDPEIFIKMMNALNGASDYMDDDDLQGMQAQLWQRLNIDARYNAPHTGFGSMFWNFFDSTRGFQAPETPGMPGQAGGGQATQNPAVQGILSDY